MTTTPDLDETDRRLLVRIWARWMVTSHTPRTSTEGYTCDEMGCLICNAGDEAEDFLVAAYWDPSDLNDGLLPDDAELVEFAGEWLAELAPAPTA